MSTRAVFCKNGISKINISKVVMCSLPYGRQGPEKQRRFHFFSDPSKLYKLEEFGTQIFRSTS
jgi:hypothetical protein